MHGKPGASAEKAPVALTTATAEVIHVLPPMKEKRDFLLTVGLSQSRTSAYAIVKQTSHLDRFISQL